MAYKVFAQDIASPFSHMVFYSLAQLNKRSEKLIGLKSKIPLQEITNTNVRWCLEENNFLILQKRLLEKIKNKNFYKLIVSESYSSLEKLNKEASLMEGRNYSIFSSKELSNILKNYINTWIEATVYGHIINMSDFHFNLLSNKVTDLINKKIEELKTKISVPEIFAVLTTPVKRSILSQQDLDLFKLLRNIQEDKKLKSLFSKSKETEGQLKKHPSWKKIKYHSKKYDWLQYHYLGPTILDHRYFIELLRGLVKQKIDAQKKIAEIINRERETVKKQKELKEKLDFSQEELFWIEMAKEFAYLKGLRKEITFIACRSYDLLLREIAKRLSISLKQLQFMTLEEIFDSLRGEKTIEADILNQRVKYCVVYYPQNKAKVYIGKKAKKLAKKIREEKIDKKIKEIKGSPAFPGKVKGEVVTIFSSEDMIKMKKGNILVSPATNPNVMPAIVKAGAIITDEGGITCHAAIVSRELKIPCIIGTKIATKVLHDGDRVEVDAEKGIVKILKKKK